MWTRAATSWTGKVDDKICQLCKEEEETPDHILRCKCLRSKAKELDPELAEIDPKVPPQLDASRSGTGHGR